MEGKDLHLSFAYADVLWRTGKVIREWDRKFPDGSSVTAFRFIWNLKKSRDKVKQKGLSFVSLIDFQ